MVFDGKSYISKHYSFSRKVLFWQMLSVTFTFEPMTLKMSSVL